MLGDFLHYTKTKFRTRDFPVIFSYILIKWGLFAENLRKWLKILEVLWKFSEIYLTYFGYFIVYDFRYFLVPLLITITLKNYCFLRFSVLVSVPIVFLIFNFQWISAEISIVIITKLAAKIELELKAVVVSVMERFHDSWQ